MRVLVIGGGLSVNEALEIVPADWPELVVSANEHGFKQEKFKVGCIVYCDPNHGRSQMASHLFYKRFDVPIFHRNGRDAGFEAIKYAAEVSQHGSVAVAGVDCTRARHPDRRYFWRHGDERLTLQPGNTSRVTALELYCKDCNMMRMPSADVWSWKIFEV